MTRHSVITGASSGIGEALARELAARGDHLTLLARRRDRLERLAGDLGVETHLAIVDLAARTDPASWIAEAENALGPIDLLVNSAGIQTIAPLPEVDPDEGDRILDVDLRAPIRITRAILPRMLSRGSGILVHVASIAAFAPTPFMSHYDAAKAGLAAFSESLQGELDGTGVHPLTVYPGPIRTPLGEYGLDRFGHAASARLAPMGTPEGLARRIVRGADRRARRIVYPGVYRFFQWFPGTARWLQARFGPRPVSRDGTRQGAA